MEFGARGISSPRRAAPERRTARRNVNAIRDRWRVISSELVLPARERSLHRRVLVDVQPRVVQPAAAGRAGALARAGVAHARCGRGGASPLRKAHHSRQGSATGFGGVDGSSPLGRSRVGSTAEEQAPPPANTAEELGDGFGDAFSGSFTASDPPATPSAEAHPPSALASPRNAAGDAPGEADGDATAGAGAAPPVPAAPAPAVASAVAASAASAASAARRVRPLAVPLALARQWREETRLA